VLTGRVFDAMQQEAQQFLNAEDVLDFLPIALLEPAGKI
jgi:hypothetical protein